MARIPKNPDDIFNEFTSDFRHVFGDDLEAIILYGSAAKGQYRYKRSDINFLLVLTENGINELGKCTPLVKKWLKRRVAPPLIVSRNYIESSLDSFPLEFMDMQANHRLVFGEDLLSDLTISTDNLRLQCERELKGKLLHLRTSFLQFAGSKRMLFQLVTQSLADFSILFTGLLHLKSVTVPATRADIIFKTVEQFSLDKSVFDRLLRIIDRQEKPSGTEWPSIMQQYIHEIRILTQTVDQLDS